MARKIEDEASLGIQQYQGSSQKFLFFDGNPPRLWTSEAEGHVAIHEASGEQVDESTIAGQIIFSSGMASVVALGSGDLHIQEKSATPVVRFLKSLPDIDPETILG